MTRSLFSEDFHRVFGVALEQFSDTLMMSISGRFEMDIIQFDQWCVEIGYVPNNLTSCRDFVVQKWGIEAAELIDRILSLKGEQNEAP